MQFNKRTKTLLFGDEFGNLEMWDLSKMLDKLHNIDEEEKRKKNFYPNNNKKKKFTSPKLMKNKCLPAKENPCSKSYPQAIIYNNRTMKSPSLKKMSRKSALYKEPIR